MPRPLRVTVAVIVIAIIVLVSYASTSPPWPMTVEYLRNVEKVFFSAPGTWSFLVREGPRLKVSQLPGYTSEGVTLMDDVAYDSSMMVTFERGSAEDTQLHNVVIHIRDIDSVEGY